MYLSHPVCITIGQVVVDGNHMDAFAFQCIQIRRKRRHQSLSFTGAHLRDPSLVQDHTADQLYPVMFHTEHAPGRFSDRGKCLRKQIIQRRAF